MRQRIVKYQIVFGVDLFLFDLASAGSDDLTTAVTEKEVAFRIEPFFRKFLRELAQREIGRDHTDAFAIRQLQRLAIRHDESAVIACDVVTVGKGINPAGPAKDHGETVPVHAKIEIALVALLLGLNMILI